MRIFLIRHAPTRWNSDKRIQGRTDIALSRQARVNLQNTTLPAPWLKIKWISSPLQRAQQTAQLLGSNEYEIHSELTEMDWGQFEGLHLSEINRRIKVLGLSPDRGLDLLPPGGESPRMARERLSRWVQTQLPTQSTLIAVTHKGVIRAALSLATGWDMQRPFEQEIDWSLPLAFESTDTGQFELIGVNCAWENTDILEPNSVSC
ncbi:MAG: histidine phosphatase family protein [bacterium]